MSARELIARVVAGLCVVAGVSILASAQAFAINGYVPGGSFGEKGAGNGQFNEPIGVAVNDSSVEGSTGDVYVVDKGNARVERFDSKGVYLSQFDGAETPAKNFSSPEWIAIDDSGKQVSEDPSAGDAYVADTGNNVIDRFSATGKYEGQLTGTCPLPGTCTAIEVIPFGLLLGVAVDLSGNVWVHDGSGNFDEFSPTGDFLTSFNNERPAQPGGLGIDSAGNVYATGGEAHLVLKFSPSGSALGEIGEDVSSFAISPSTNDLLVDTASNLELYGPFGEPNNAPIQVLPSKSLAESHGIAVGASETAYASQRLADNIKIFNNVPLPPVVEDESVSSVGSGEAKLGAEINAQGEPTSYRVEYGTSSQYGLITPQVSAGASTSAVPVSMRLAGLQSGVEYHFRFVSTSQNGSTTGTDMTFVTTATLGPSALVLPDERTYELVSPSENPGEVYVPTSAITPTQDINTDLPFRASVGGDAVVYAGDPPALGGTGNTGRGEGDEYLAVRGASGWVANDIEPYETNPGLQEGYEAFSPDLSVGILKEFNRPPDHPAVAPDAPSHCSVLYARVNDNGSGQNPYSALFTKANPSGNCGQPLFAGAAVDDSHILFQDEVALAPGVEEAAGQEAEKFCRTHCNLYDSVSGRLRVVNLLPGGKVVPNAVFGGPPGESNNPDFSNVISADGSRIFWTDLNTNLIYAREDASRTVQISAGAARFWTASPNGRYVFYTEGEKLMLFDLDRFDASGKPEAQALAEAREELTGEGAEVQGVLGTNETGEAGAYVYFVAAGALAPGAEKRACETVGTARTRREEEIKTELSNEESMRFNEEEGEEATGKLLPGLGCNLYLLHAGEPIKLVGTLAKTDNEMLGLNNSSSGVSVVGDWQANLGARTAEVSSDGRGLVFESTLSRSLTGYDNYIVGGEKPRAEPEVFVYDADTGRVSCASCMPSGAPPPASAAAKESVPLPSSISSTFMRRWISEDGSRVFFDAGQALVPQDANGVQDVYEWEREGTPGCPTQAPGRLDGGCVSLLSGGGGTDWSWLVDASTSGGDVFFATRAQLAVADRNEKMDLYDARVDGGFPEVKLSCTGTGCQGVPPAPPIFATPSSVTFSGVGNFEPAPKASVKPKRKATKCKKSRVRKHGKCVKPQGKKTRKSSKRSSRRKR